MKFTCTCPVCGEKWSKLKPSGICPECEERREAAAKAPAPEIDRMQAAAGEEATPAG